MSGLRADAREKLGRWSKESFSTLWKTALVRLPRAVPLEALYLTNPNGPLPYKLLLPSRHSGKTVQVFVFLPPVTFPSQDSGSTEPTPNSFPVVMDYHGGGFYLGSCLEQAPFCSRLCRELNAIVIGVDYRMAPFDKFPAAIEDADDVVQSVLNPQWPGYDMLRQSIASFYQAEWFGTIGSKEDRDKGKVPTPPPPTIHLDSTRIAFSGASSGGNIALNMGIDVDATMGMPSWSCPIPADYPHPVPLLLLYPALDLRQLPGERHLNEQMTLAKSKKGEKKLDIDDHLAATYVSREMAGHPRASPGLVNTATALHKNAKILLILTGLDTLWEQSEIWTKKVEAEGRGKDMKTMRYEDRKHGWTQIPEIALSKEERRTRLEVLDECVRFTDLTWRGKNPVEVMECENGENVAAQGDDALKARDQQL